MAWQCSGKTNEALIDNLVREGILRTPRVIAAFRAVDRALFVQNVKAAYMDSPCVIGHGATISAPHMHAAAVENLEPFLKVGAKVLDIGCGSGYLLSTFHYLVSPTCSNTTFQSGQVVGIDHLAPLVQLSRENISKSPTTRAVLDRDIKVMLGDGREGCAAGDIPAGGWDVIHVGAAAPTLPEALLKQLRNPGRIFIPIGEENQAVWQIDKDSSGVVTKTRLFGVRYIPLTDARRQDRS